MKHVLLTVVALCGCLLVTGAQSLPQDSVTRCGVLPNGLTYYVRNNLRVPGQADFYIAQEVGSVQEEDNQRGLAHFLEHMCFNGTEHYPGDKLLRYLEGIGVKFGEQLNAYTSFEETVYNINNVPTARVSTVDSVLLILRDWSCGLSLEDEEIDKERGVIHEEWRQSTNAQMRILERQFPVLMSGCRSGSRMPIGLMSVVDSFPYQALRDYYKRWYRPDLQAIIVVGDVDVERTEAKIREMFSTVPVQDKIEERIYFGVPDNSDAIVVTDSDPEQNMVIVSFMQKHDALWPVNEKNSIGYLRHEAILSLVKRMFKARVDEIQLRPETPYLGMYFDEREFLSSKVTRCTSLDIVPKDGMTYESLETAVKELCRVLDHGFVQSELDRSRASLLAYMELRYENRGKRENGELVQKCVDNFLQNEPLLSVETETSLYREILPTITLDEVNAMFSRLVNRDMKNTVVLAMNPEKEGFVQPVADSLLLAIKHGMAAETEAYEDELQGETLIRDLPQAGTIVGKSEGRYGGQELVLSNGVRVVMLPTTHSDNEVLMQAYSPGGTSRYGVEDAVTLTLAGTLCDVSGRGGYRQTELRKLLAGRQAQAGGSMGVRNEYVHGGSSRQDLETMLQLVYLQFQPLLCDNEAAQNIMMQYRTMLEGKDRDPMQQFSDSISATTYGDNPRNVILNKEALSKVDYSRALEIWADRFADASDFTFFFVGTFDEDTLSDLCCKYLATLPVKERDDSPVNIDLVMREGHVNNIYATRMEQPQCVSVVTLHAPAQNKNLKDELAIGILAQSLDMSFIKSIREELGASYGIGVSGALEESLDGGWDYVINVGGSVKPEMYDTCLTVIRQELERVAREGIAPEHMQRIKQYMQKTYAENQTRNQAWLSYLQDFYRYGIDSERDYLSTLETVSQEDIKRLMQTVLQADNQITVVMLPEEKK